MLAIGLMSGTSMDGVDAALIKTNGASLITFIEHVHIGYPATFKLKLKTAETNAWKNNGKLLQLNLNDLTKQSTKYHQEAVSCLIKKTNISSHEIGIIGYHGQTLLHNPQKKISLIIGNGQELANRTGIPVINDFRSADILSGGQGAPLAPLFHHALAQRDNMLPLAVVNCGGIANITFAFDENPSNIISFDTGPGNVLIDRIVRERTQNSEHMDKNGKYGKQGTINKQILKQLNSTAVKIANKNYLLLPPPKSLDTNNIQLPLSINKLSLADACATLEWFTAATITQSLLLIKQNPPAHWILAGGGWNNPIILKYLRLQLKKHIKGELLIQTADECRWDSASLEAQLFAWLAVRSLKKLPLSMPSTTGVNKPTTGGTHYIPSTCSSSV